MVGDLHCHTRLSDGSMSADEVVCTAKRLGLTHVAITDHDCLLPKAEAKRLSEEYGICVIDGTELSCIDESTGRKVHMLCLAPKAHEEIDAHCKTVQADRDRAGIKMAKKAEKLFPITLDEVIGYKRESKSIFKQHIMRAIIERGFTLDFYGELYKELFKESDGKCYEYVKYPTVDFAIDLIHRAGGRAVLAHPRVYKSMELAKSLANAGKIDGIEVFHHSTDEDTRRELLALCKENRLIITGGSDFHGMYSACPRVLGSNRTDEENLKRIAKEF